MYSSPWYNSLTKPPFSPPDWIFTPTWIILYTAIFISLILYITKAAPNKKTGYLYFSAQMILNLLWSFVFFRIQNMALALIVIIFMAIFTFLTIKNFYIASKTSAILLVPYLLWIIFAAYLNAGYLLLN